MTFPIVNAELFCRIECNVGEGPFWHENRLYWVDIFGRWLHSCNSHGHELGSLRLPSHVGAVAPWKSGFIAGTKEGIGLLTREGAFDLLPESPVLPADHRYNDGKLDPAGRFWCGTMTYEGLRPVGELYRVERNGRIKRMLEGLTIANGLDWDMTAGLFYYVDTPTQRVDVFDYDLASGEITNRRLAFEVPEEFGIPDGMARDSAGRLWVACWGGSRVVAFDPRNGRVLGEVRVPAQLTSSCCIGPDAGSIYITSARSTLTPEQRAREPLAGSVFRAELPP